MSKIIKFPNKTDLSREEFKMMCHKIIDRIEGDFSISFSNEEDIFYNQPKCDTLIVTTNSDKHKEMNSSFKIKHYKTQIKED